MNVKCAVIASAACIAMADAFASATERSLDVTEWDMADGEYFQDFSALGKLDYPASFEDVLSAVPGLQAYTNGVALPSFILNGGGSRTINVYVFATNKSDVASYSVGSISTGGRKCMYGLSHSNGTNLTVTNITISFDARQLNNKNPVANIMRFQYTVSDAAKALTEECEWCDVPELAWTMPLTTNDVPIAYAETNLYASVPVRVLPGEHVIYRWVDDDEKGRDTCSAIDNVAIRYSFRDSGPLVIRIR